MDDNFAQYPEIGILSVVIKNPDTLSECADKIKPYMFTSTPNRCLFETLLSLRENGVFADYSILIASLYSSNKLGECGGESYLKYLINQDFSQVNLEKLCDLLINSYKYRELISLTTSIPNIVAGKAEIEDTIGYIRTFLDNLSNYGSVDGIISFQDAIKKSWELLLERTQSDNKIVVTTGYKNLDDVTGGFGAGDLWVIAGRPGMGKSASMCNSILSGVPSLIFSKEMTRDSLIQRLISIKSGVPIFNLRLGSLTQKQLDKVQETIREIKSLPIYIDTTYNSTIEYVVSTIRKYKSLYDIKVAHLDYIQLFVERDENATNEIGRFTRQLKLLSNNLNTSTVVYSQLNRLVETRTDKRPILSDLRQSGNIEEDVDVAIFLYRDNVYNSETKHAGEVEFIIRKQRNGPVGTLVFNFDEVTNCIHE